MAMRSSIREVFANGLIIASRSKLIFNGWANHDINRQILSSNTIVHGGYALQHVWGVFHRFVRHCKWRRIKTFLEFLVYNKLSLASRNKSPCRKAVREGAVPTYQWVIAYRWCISTNGQAGSCAVLLAPVPVSLTMKLAFSSTFHVIIAIAIKVYLL